MLPPISEGGGGVVGNRGQILTQVCQKEGARASHCKGSGRMRKAEAA